MSKRTVSTAVILATAGFLLLAGVQTGTAAPRPSLVPLAGTWQLDFQLHGEPEQISVVLPGDTRPTRFWYLLYTVTNNTDRDIDFYPRFELLTDTLKLYQGGVRSRRQVYDAIRARYDKTVPLLETEYQITGRILSGKDNARDSVAIFEDFDPNATSITIFLAGLTNETVRVLHPAPEIVENETPEILLRKTLALEYQVPGDRFNPGNRVMLYRGRKWIMR